MDRVRKFFRRLPGWNMKYGRWWMVQWQWDWWLSLGIHIDLRHRRQADGHTYGPYVDLHIGFVVISIGWNPAYSGELDRILSVSRGGL